MRGGFGDRASEELHRDTDTLVGFLICRTKNQHMQEIAPLVEHSRLEPDCQRRPGQPRFLDLLGESPALLRALHSPYLPI